MNSLTVTAMSTDASNSARHAAHTSAGSTGDTACGERGSRPVRLASWVEDLETSGRPSGPDHGVIVAGHDEALPATDGEVWDPRPWIDRMREEHPDRTIAVLYDDPGASRSPTSVQGRPAPWLLRLDDVLECIGGASARFVIDSSAGSLAALRHDIDAELTRRSGPAISEEMIADTVLMVDELVSNAVEHADGGVTIDLSLADEALIVAVSDPHPGRLPVLGRPPPLQPSGRGLLVVDALAIRWGTVIDRRSKSVWAEAAWPG